MWFRNTKCCCSLESKAKALLSRACFLFLAWSKPRLCSANHRAGYWSNLPCDWPSTAWAYYGASLTRLKLLRPDDSHKAWSALVQVMAWHLFGAKPLPEPILTYCQHGPMHIKNKLLLNINQITKDLLKKMHFNMSSAECLPFCPGFRWV